MYICLLSPQVSILGILCIPQRLEQLLVHKRSEWKTSLCNWLIYGVWMAWYMFPPNTGWCAHLKLVDLIQFNIYWAPTWWRHWRNKDKWGSHCPQKCSNVTIMSTFLSIPLNIQGVKSKLMVTFALCIHRKNLRFYPLFLFLDLVLKHTAITALVFWLSQSMNIFQNTVSKCH